MTFRSLFAAGALASAAMLFSSTSAFAQTAGARTHAPTARPAPGQVAPNPAIPAQNPATPAPNPATPPQNPATPARNPATPSPNPATRPQNPATPAQNPATPIQNPATPPQNPATPAQNPAIPPRNPATPSPSPIAPAQSVPPNQQIQPGVTTPNTITPNGTPIVSTTAGVQLSPQTRPFYTGLAGLNLANPNVQGVANLIGTMNAAQATTLIQTVNANPQVRQTASILTQQLRQLHRITQDQQVVGVHNGRVYVATNAQVANATAGVRNGQVTALQPSTMIGGLVTANGTAQTMNIAGVTTATSNLLNPNQLAAVYQSLNTNVQARQAADRLTLRLLADGRIRGNQQVIGFQNGRAIVTAPDQ